MTVLQRHKYWFTFLVRRSKVTTVRLQPHIIVLDKDPKRNAAAMHDRHLTGTISGNLAVLRAAVDSGKGVPFRSHILTRWLHDARAWWWTARLIDAQLQEAAFRFDALKLHIPCEALELQELQQLRLDEDYNQTPSRFVQLCGDIRVPGDPVAAYRAWYIKNSVGEAWTRRGTPEWWKGTEQFTLPFEQHPIGA